MHVPDFISFAIQILQNFGQVLLLIQPASHLAKPWGLQLPRLTARASLCMIDPCQFWTDLYPSTCNESVWLNRPGNPDNDLSLGGSEPWQLVLQILPQLCVL